MIESKRRYRAPLVLKVLGSEPQVFDTNTVNWKGQEFASHFSIELKLEDKEPNTSLYWFVNFEIEFRDLEPYVNSIKVSGLSKHLREDLKEWREEQEPVQVWQLNYLTKNLHLLRRACFELGAKQVSITETSVGAVYSTSGSSYTKEYTKAHKLEEFARSFDEWQGRTKLTDRSLQEIAEIYQAEISSANQEGRRATPAKVIQQLTGKPLPTVNRWIAKARAENFLPKIEKSGEN